MTATAPTLAHRWWERPKTNPSPAPTPPPPPPPAAPKEDRTPDPQPAADGGARPPRGPGGRAPRRGGNGRAGWRLPHPAADARPMDGAAAHAWATSRGFAPTHAADGSEIRFPAAPAPQIRADIIAVGYRWDAAALRWVHRGTRR